MEWYIMNIGGAASLCSNLGHTDEEGTYIPGENCADLLDELIEQFEHHEEGQDKTKDSLHCHDFLNKDLLPMIKTIKNDVGIFFKAVRLFVYMTRVSDRLPQVFEKQEKKYHDRLMHISLDKQLISSVIQEALDLMEEAEPYDIDEDSCEIIKHCLLLIRNLMFMGKCNLSLSDCHNRYRLMFECGLEQLLLNMVKHKQKGNWSPVIVQIIWLLCCGKLDIILGIEPDIMRELLDQKAFREVLLIDCSPSSDDIFLDQAQRGVSLDFAIYNFAENLLPFYKNVSMLSAVITDKLLSEEPGFFDINPDQKTGGEAGSLDVLGTVAVKDFSYYLRSFVYKLVNTGFIHLINDLKMQILHNEIEMDENFLLWSISFCTMVTSATQFDVKVIRPLLSREVVGYLVYKCVSYVELIHTQQHSKATINVYPKKIAMALNSLKIILNMVNYLGQNEGEEEKALQSEILKDLTSMKDLRKLFILLLHRHNPSQQSLGYLNEIIVTTHLFLLMVDTLTKQGVLTKDTMIKFVQGYSSAEIMYKYGLCLQNFSQNHAYINNAALTMMYHVAGECKHPESLLQESILTSFLEIMDSELFVCQEVIDLMEYILTLFIHKAKTDPFSCTVSLFGEEATYQEVSSDSDSSNLEEEEEGEEEKKGDQKAVEAEDNLKDWSEEENDALRNIVFELGSDWEEDVTCVVDALKEININKTKEQVSRQIKVVMEEDNMQQGSDPPPQTSAASGINKTKEQVENEEVKEDEEKELGGSSRGSAQMVDRQLWQLGQVMTSEEVISMCLHRLQEAKCEAHVYALQSQLCEAAYVKLCAVLKDFKQQEEEPILKFNHMQNKSLPLVLGSKEEEKMLENKHYYLLLVHLGLFVNADTNIVFPRIPNDWSPKQLIDKAALLGKLPEDVMKFEVDKVEDLKEYSQCCPVSFKKKNIHFKCHKETCKMRDLAQQESIRWDTFVTQYNARQAEERGQGSLNDSLI